ncbi:MAG: hypothetical protein ACW98X_10360 [Promethearchaeota archaeon]|jgi:hypothetical protein
MSSTKKKSTQQTISISPELKERIEKYVMINQEKFPDDKRFRSISSFYTSVMEKSLDCFAKGKTLDDFESFVDSEIKDFFDKISFNGLIPYYEVAIKSNKYIDPTFEKIPLFFLTLRRLYLSLMDPTDIKTIKNMISRLRNYLLSNNLTKEIRLDLLTGSNANEIKGIFEYSGIYKNLCFETCKSTAAIFGLLGVKITKCLYSEKDLYYRFDLQTTELFFRKELAKKEIIQLIQHNISHLINYSEIINDLDYYLWIKMADAKDVILNFNNEVEGEEWVDLIKKDISKFTDEEDFPLYLLKLFEKMHWIEIENDKDLIFYIRLSKKYQNEKEFLLNTLSKYSSIEKANGKHYLKKNDF